MKFNLKKSKTKQITADLTDVGENTIEPQDNKPGLLTQANAKLLVQPPKEEGIIYKANIQVLLGTLESASNMEEHREEDFVNDDSKKQKTKIK